MAIIYAAAVGIGHTLGTIIGIIAITIEIATTTGGTAATIVAGIAISSLAL